MDPLIRFARRPDGNAIATFFNQPIAIVVNALQTWGGRFKVLKYVGTRPTSNPFIEYCVAGNEQAFTMHNGWSIHCDNSTTLISGLPSSLARIAKCIAIRVTIPVDNCRYPCVRLEYHNHTNEESSRLISVMLDGNRWRFDTGGTPFAFEDMPAYDRRKLRDRLTPVMIESYLRKLGCVADPFELAICDVYSLSK